MAPLRIQPRARIIETAAHAFGVTYEDMIGRRRDRPVVHARWAAILVIREQWPTFSLTQIGKMLGRDHSTICHAVAGGTDLYERDETFREYCRLIAANREPFGPPKPIIVPITEPKTAECELKTERVRQARERQEASETEKNWTLALAHIRKGSRDLLAAIRVSHPERFAA
jgi:hypothetical protein